MKEFFYRTMSKVLKTILFVVFLYIMTAYLLIPDFWKHYSHLPELENFPKTSFTKEGLPGDPLNTGLVGSEEEIIRGMKLAGWQQADRLRLSSDVKIAESVLFNQSYPTAPVSDLYLFNHSQDLAFEKQMQGSPRHRHHVRFWKTNILGDRGRPLWIGSATFDQTVGLSHATGQITHHIAPDIDQERDLLIRDMMFAGQLLRVYQVSGVGPSFKGRNGALDSYFTDGEITIGVVSYGNSPKENPLIEDNPIQIELKNRSWDLLKSFL